jgi:hypothetical protein
MAGGGPPGHAVHGKQQRRIRSPFNGVITERLQHASEIAQTGKTARTLLRTAQAHPAARGGNPACGEARKDQAGRAPTLMSSHRCASKVCSGHKVVDSASGTFGVRLGLPHLKGKIPARLRCRVSFK